MTTDQLLPCPFCGKTNTLKIITAEELANEGEDDPLPWEHSASWAVVCDASSPRGPGGCGAMGGFMPTEAEAATVWNMRAQSAVVNESLTTEREVCEWREEDPWGPMPDTYATSCGEMWSLVDGGPAENRVKFCHRCGKPVTVVPYSQPVDEDAADGVKSEPLVHIPKDSRAGKPPCGECHLQPGETCDICGADGAAPAQSCPACKGAGWVNTWVADDSDRSGQSDRREDVTCPDCDGTGKAAAGVEGKTK